MQQQICSLFLQDGKPGPHILEENFDSKWNKISQYLYVYRQDAKYLNAIYKVDIFIDKSIKFLNSLKKCMLNICTHITAI